MEIGSEYYSVGLDDGGGIVFPREGSLTFSGRTATEAVLKKIPYAKTALLPSYCCDSIIEPFRRAGIKVDFYEVNYEDELIIKINAEADILFWCNYFGFKYEIPDFNGIIIEDITHSLLSDVPCHQQSDYLVASVRKWEPIISGGYCSVNVNGEPPPQAFVDEKLGAMRLKKQYLLDHDTNKKKKFLSAFNHSNKWLADNYSGLIIDPQSKQYIEKVDIEKQKKARRKNAHILYEALKNKVEFLFSEEDMDCPLFVPIIIKNNRDIILRHLIDNKIYCPIHWPRPNAQSKSNLYDLELSLICDQRYSQNEMEKIISVLKKI